MQHTIHCSCGYTCSSSDSEELFSLIRGHINHIHPERHRPTTQATQPPVWLRLECEEVARSPSVARSVQHEADPYANAGVTDVKGTGKHV